MYVFLETKFGCMLSLARDEKMIWQADWRTGVLAYWCTGALAYNAVDPAFGAVASLRLSV